MTDLRRTIDALAEDFVNKLARAIKDAPLSELADASPRKRRPGRPRKQPPVSTP